MYFTDNQIKQAQDLFKKIDDRKKLDSYFSTLTYNFETPIELEGKLICIEDGKFKMDYDGEIEIESFEDFDTQDLIQIYKDINK